MNVAVKFPVPAPDGVTEHQAASLDAVQANEEVTAKTVVPGYDQTAWLEGETTNDAEEAACTTVTTMGVGPLAVTVMLAVLGLAVVLAV